MGVTDEDVSTDLDSAMAFFSKIYAEVNTASIDDYLAKQKGSNQEREDIIKFFQNNKGKVSSFLEVIIGSEIEDTNR